MGFIRFISPFIFIGMLIPLVFQLIWWLENSYQIVNLNQQVVIQKVMLMTWPASIMMLPAINYDSYWVIALTVSTFLNILTYSFVGLLIWYGYMNKHYFILVLLVILISFSWWKLLNL